jgi:beta-glucosidase
MHFADDFTWGVASASYQIEGALNADGRGESVWDMFCRKSGAVWSGHSGAPACDHYPCGTDIAEIEFLRCSRILSRNLHLSPPESQPNRRPS